MKRIWLSKEHGLFFSESGHTWFRGTIQGLGRKEFALSKERLTLKQAIKRKENKIAEMLGVKRAVARRLPRFEDLCEEVIALKANKAPATLTSAKLQFRKHLIPWFNDHYPYLDEINEATWEEYILAQQQVNPNRKLFNDTKHMRMVMRHAYRKGLLPRLMQFRDPDPERSAGRRLTQEEFNRLLLAAAPTLKLQLYMAMTMGMRKSEILKLAWDRVDLSKRTIHLRAIDTKIRRARTMGMSESVEAELRRLEQKGRYVFPSRYDQAKPMETNKTAWAACKRRAKVKARFHDLRHTFLSNALLERKINPLHVAVYAGVSLVEIQKTYLHPTVDDTREVAFNFGVKLGEQEDDAEL